MSPNQKSFRKGILVEKANHMISKSRRNKDEHLKDEVDKSLRNGRQLALNKGENKLNSLDQEPLL